MQNIKVRSTLTKILNIPSSEYRHRERSAAPSPDSCCDGSVEGLRETASDLSSHLAEVEAVLVAKEVKVFKPWQMHSLRKKPSCSAPETSAISDRNQQPLSQTDISISSSQPSIPSIPSMPFSHLSLHDTVASSTDSTHEQSPSVTPFSKHDVFVKVLEDNEYLSQKLLQYGTAILRKIDKPTIDLDKDFSSQESASQRLGRFSSRTEVKDLLREKYRLNHLVLLSLLRVSEGIQKQASHGSDFHVDDALIRELRKAEIKNSEIDLRYLKVWKGRVKQSGGDSAEGAEYAEIWNMMESAKRDYERHTTLLLALDWLGVEEYVKFSLVDSEANMCTQGQSHNHGRLMPAINLAMEKDF